VIRIRDYLKIEVFWITLNILKLRKYKKMSEDMLCGSDISKTCAGATVTMNEVGW